MRSSARGAAARIIVGLLVVACASTPSLSPTASLAPVASTTPSASSPVSAPGATPSAPPKIVAISAGQGHTCALTAGGGVKCWGANGAGQLGDGTLVDRTTPVDVVGLGSGVVAISAGASHTCAITTTGGLKCWGSNDYGELGNGSRTISVTPLDVSGLSSGVIAVSAGMIHTCAVTTGGGAKCWGYNSFGGLGNGQTAESLVPVDVRGLSSGVAAIATGYEHACALTTRGEVKCWGAGRGGLLGNGSTESSLVPIDVPGFGSEATLIATSIDHVCAVKTGGRIFCWGGNYGTAPVSIAGLASDVPAIAAGSYHACLITSAAGVSCWGSNQYGQLGNGSTTESANLVDVTDLAGGVTAIDAGSDHTCALTTAGEVRCWGDNWTGQLGDGRPCETKSVATRPVVVAFSGPVVQAGEVPPGRIDHLMGPTDVVLRYDSAPDFAVSDLTGELFQPGPEFTLYGDGTAIFRNDRGEVPARDGPILRGRPFTTAHLTGDQVQALLRFALGDGGLMTACEFYETRDLDGFGTVVITVHTGVVDKRIESSGGNPLGPLVERLLNLDRGGSVPTRIWGPDRFRGSLLDASIFVNIGDGLVPGLAEAGSLPWPWPGIAPEDFITPPDPGWESPRRILSAAEAAVLGFSEGGGVVRRVYLRGPDDKALYYFSMWPVFPDETG